MGAYAPFLYFWVGSSLILGAHIVMYHLPLPVLLQNHLLFLDLFCPILGTYLILSIGMCLPLFLTMFSIVFLLSSLSIFMFSYYISIPLPNPSLFTFPFSIALLSFLKNSFSKFPYITSHTRGFYCLDFYTLVVLYLWSFTPLFFL